MYQKTLKTDRRKNAEELEAISERMRHIRMPVIPGRSLKVSKIGIELLAGLRGLSVCRLLNVEISPESSLS